MRILAVRGQNLASLAEPFAVDLTADPLATAGLFAITGETGAGKSTLLDAVCLALYGDFPRLGGRGGGEEIPDGIDGEALKAHDPRSILRRGAASGWAEVDFVGIDGAAYRAHWAAYRARGRPGGRLQPAIRRIDRLGPAGGPIETLADKIGTADARVVELTDLTFDQFRRTVVLAQGDFDAFLRADDKERADLLEKITGTEIYARLSARAFEKARSAREALALLEARRREIGLLDAETLAERHAARADLQHRIDETAAEREATRAEIAALDRLAEAETRLAEAERERAAAEAARDAAAESRDHLARLDRAASLRPVFDRLAEARAAEAAAVAAFAEIERRLAAATPALEVAREARDAGRRTLDLADAAVERWTPAWEAAAALDVRIEEARRAAIEAEVPRRAARDRLDAETARLAALDARRLDLAATAARHTQELARLGALAPLAARWTDVETRLFERVAATAEIAEAAARRERAGDEIAEIGRRLAERASAEEADAAAKSEAEARLAERTALLAAVGETEARRRDTRLAGAQDAIAAALPIAVAARDARDEIARAGGEAHAAELAAEAAQARRITIEAERTTALARRAGLAAAADLADAVVSAEAARLRATLLDDEPCPVCGARDHPVAADPTVLAALGRVRAERTTVEAEIAALDRTVAEIDGAFAAAKSRRTEAEDRARLAETRLAEAVGRLAETLPSIAHSAVDLGFAFDLQGAAIDAVAPLSDLAATVRTARAETAGRIDNAGRLVAEIDLVRRRLTALEAERSGRATARRAEEAAAANARADLRGAEEAERAARRRLAEIDAVLAPLLGGLEITPADLDRDGSALIERIGRGVAEHRALSEAIAAARAEEKDLERLRLAAREGVVRIEEALIGAQATLSTKREALARLLDERAVLLDGRPTAEHRDAVLAERSAAATTLAAAEQTLAEAWTAHETALTLHGERHAALAEAQEEARARETERDHALAAADLDRDQIDALLAEPKELTDAARTALSEIDRRLTRAHVAVAERQSDRDALLAAGSPTIERAAIEARLAAAREAGEALNREIGALDQILAADEAARRTAAGLEREIAEAVARRDVLGAVEEAIGSRDGDRFRRFAQGVTLDRLTELANRHLASLAPRYRLARADGLGLTIVDRDMGDELRSTRSLSGGERFLASLALALALSGLEGRRSFVDTLFVDEGFGSLDAATLDVAIDALEALQSEGRKVGVISHVSAMHDRIPVQIRVEKAGAGRSRVRVVGAP